MDVKAKAFQNAINTLKALETQFVIVDKDGVHHTHGDIQVAEKKKTRSKLMFPRGTYKQMVHEQGLLNMQVGDVFLFDPKETQIESLRSTIISQADKLWGNRSITTTIRDGKIEAFRVL